MSAQHNGFRNPEACLPGPLARLSHPALCLLLLILALLAGPAWAQQAVRVGVYQNTPKVALSDSGKPEGIFIDVIEAIARKEGWQIEYLPGTWAEGLARLQKGEIDLMPDVARSQEREGQYAFHREPVLASWNQVYTRRGSGVRSLLDLETKRIAVLEGSVQQGSFAQIAAGFDLSTKMVTYPDFDAAFDAVARGQADAVITNRFFGVRNAGKYGLEDTAIIFSPSKLYFAAPRAGREALLAAIDRNLVELKKDSDSVYYRSVRRWAVEDVRAATPAWLAPAAAALIAILLAAVAWVALLRRQVAAKTQEIRLRSEEILVINRTLRATGSQRELDAVLDEAVKGALALTGFDGGVLCIRDEQNCQLRAGASIGAAGQTDRAADGGGLRDEACPAMLECIPKGQRRVVLAGDAPGVPRPCGNVSDPSVRWNAYFPLEVQDRTIGILCLFSRKAEPPPEHAMELVEDICGPVALAMENATLHEQARRHTQELEKRVERRTAEIAKLTAFLQAIIDHVANPIFYKGPDLRFLGCNLAYERTFGVSRKEIIGKTALELALVPQADRQGFHDEQAQMLSSGAAVRREAALPFADGKMHQILYSAGAFQLPDGAPGGLVGTIVDITSLKETEAALLDAKQRAEAADRLKSAFLATMSHELRTPLNSIIGFTGIVLAGLAGPLNEEQGKQLGMVRDSARHLLALINDVLDISKIEAGELTVARESFDLPRSIAKVAAIVEPLAAKKGLALAVEVAPGIGTMVSDARRVEQVLLNLLGNAIKFTEAGSVTLKAETISDYQAGSLRPRAAAVRLSVIDTGIGIKPEEMPILFTPFRQIDSTLSRKHEGTGLGLAICRRLTDLMGGEIEARSVAGQGSVFTVTLPLQPEPVLETS